MGMLGNGVPSEATLCRVEDGIDELGFAGQMATLSKASHDELVKGCGFLEIIRIDGKVDTTFHCLHDPGQSIEL